MWARARVVVPGLLVPGGGYLALGAWRQGLAFLSIGLLVGAIWTRMFTELHWGLALFWGVLCLAAVLGADTVSRQSLGQSRGIAWTINAGALFVAFGLLVGRLLALLAPLGDDASAVAMTEARRLLVIGQLSAFGLGGMVVGWWAPRPVRTAAWGALLALGWSLARGVRDVGAEAALEMVRARLPHLAGLYALSLGAALAFAWLTSRVARPGGRVRVEATPPRTAPPPVTPPRTVHLHAPETPESDASPPSES